MILPSGAEIQAAVLLAPITSWLVGGQADFLVQPKTEQELREAIAWASLKSLPITIFGGGTNVLIADDGIRGLTIALRKFSGAPLVKEIDGKPKRLTIECLAGTSKSELLKIFLRHRLEPALFLAGIPGDVGGGIAMNAGVGETLKPREFTELTDWIEVLRWPSSTAQAGKALGPKSETQSEEPPSPAQICELASQFRLHRIQASDLKWSYRHCEGWRPGVIVRAGLSWPFSHLAETGSAGSEQSDLLSRVKQANHVRLSKQPLDQPSCGSVFINPPGFKSGQLIEQSGLKGFTIGGAKVSEKHANFIVNTGGATAMEIHQVIEKVKAVILEKNGVVMKTEVVYLGDWGAARRYT